jgi:hypothetical protein
VAPAAAAGVRVLYLDPSAPWAAGLGASRNGRVLRAALAATASVTFDDRAAGVDHREVWESIHFPVAEHMPVDAGTAVDFDPRDFSTEPAQASYELPDAPLDEPAFYRRFARELAAHLVRSQQLELFRSPHLGLYSRHGETRDEFLERTDAAAQARADAEAAKLRDKMEARLDRLTDRIEAAKERRDLLEVDARERKQQEMVAGAGALVSALFGGRASARSIAARAARALGSASSRRSMSARTEERLAAAEARVDEASRELEEMETELMTTLSRLDDEWSTKGREVETLVVPPEASDVKIEDVSLVWVPVE